jgi:hypothetical protein
MLIAMSTGMKYRPDIMMRDWDYRALHVQGQPVYSMRMQPKVMEKADRVALPATNIEHRADSEALNKIAPPFWSESCTIAAA